MIVPMKKAAIITQSKDARSAIKKLRSLGVMHMEHQAAPRGVDITELTSDIALAQGALNILASPEFSKRLPAENGRRVKDWKAAAKHVVESSKRLEHLEEYLRLLSGRIMEWEGWGDFSPEAVEKLAEKGIYIRLYEVPSGQMNNFPPEVIVKRVFAAGGTTGCAVISSDKTELPFREIMLPKMSLGAMRERLKEDTKTIRSIKENIARHLCYKETFARIKNVLKKELELHEALAGMGAAGGLSYLVGYVPHDAVERLSGAARAEKWGLFVRDPSDEDNVPTLVRNPRWVSIIEPVFRAIEIVPGYRELDISMWFLLFLSIFFGILIGDAGYGIIYLILTFAAQKRWGNLAKARPAFILFKILSLSAVTWGVLTGTFFGQDWMGSSIRPLMPALRDDRSVQVLCFFLGALHLSIAHAWRGLKKFPHLSALSDIGWVCILWGGFFLANMLILGEAFPPAGKWLFATGIALVLFFTSPQKNIARGLGKGAGELLLNFINSFTDIVSYIRLFAVGLASVEIADAFNRMAMDVGWGTFARGAITSLVLGLGHCLNMLLGPLAVLVHGVRLNVLEFCSHLDIKWKGTLYKPLEEGAAGDDAAAA